MEELEALVRQHKFVPSRYRVNLGGEVREYQNSRFLKQAILSNTVREGPLLECVQSMLGPQINTLCLNKNVTCGPHRDGKNSGSESSESFICFFGDFQGGALVLETGEWFEEKGVWHRFNGRDTTHWNEPHTGDKYSVVAYTRKHPARAPRRPARAANQNPPPLSPGPERDSGPGSRT